MGQRGDWGPQAIRLNTQILEQEPDNLSALIRRGRCFLEQDDYAEAREDYLLALEVDLSNKIARAGLSRIREGWDEALARAGQRAERKRAEEEDLRRVDTLTSFKEARSLGITACDRHPPNYAVAIAALRKAYQLDPNRKLKPGNRPPTELFEVPTRLARVYRKSGQLNQAQRVYEWILEHCDSVHAKVGLAAVYEDRRKHKMARQLYEEVLARDPNNPAALRGIARTLASLDKGEEAAKSYWRAGVSNGSRR